MRSRPRAYLRLGLIICGVLVFAPGAFADGNGRNARDIAIIDRALAKAKKGDRAVKFGDVWMRISDLQTYRSRLVAQDSAASTGTATGVNAQAQGVTPLLLEGTAPLWTNGQVYYQFDPGQVSSGTITAAKEQMFRDSAAEWAGAANLQFIEVTGTPPANYIAVQEISTTGEGGDSFVGMVGGAQALHVSSVAWNRGTLCHEIGHALGLNHEQCRSDRDTYVTINTSNIPSGDQADFAKLPGTIIGPYDFYSVMQYSQFAFAINPSIPTIAMNPGFTQYANIIGNVTDRTLSKLDRAGMAVMYGNPATLPSAIVTNTKDSGPGSLRAALYYAIDQSTASPPVATTIQFHIPKTDPNYNATTGVFTIRPTYMLPAPGNGTTIDGTTEQTFTGGNTNPSGGPSIVISGASAALYEGIGAGYAPAMILRAANCTVKGIVIDGYDVEGLQITGTSATGNVVSGCYIGTDSTGSVSVPNKFSGIEISGGAYINTIGGTTAAARNVISGNTSQGIYMHDAGTTGNVIEGNYMGVAASGTVALGNGFEGVDVENGAQGNTIGGTTAAARNIISGNTAQGILMTGTATMNNVVTGNYIGLDATGTATLANGSGNVATLSFYAGIQIAGGANNNVIGGTSAGAGNVISGNVGAGIAIGDSGSNANLIEGNVIGLNATGTAAKGNGSGDAAANPPLFYSGVDIFGGAQSNIVGGTAAGTGNVISGNVASGVSISGSGSTGNLVEGNLIGTNAAGTTAFANGNASASAQFAGLQLFNGAQSNVIGGTTAAARNIISGNAGQGVVLADYTTNLNLIEGNYIGTDVTGTLALPNSQGVGIFNAPASNTIGGTSLGAGNVISGNAGDGVAIADSENTYTGTVVTGTFYPTQNVVAGNFIGVNSTGTKALANGGNGVDLFAGAVTNLIGGAAAGARNVISGNNQVGVAISQQGTNGNLVQGNWIGIGTTSTAIPNLQEGVAVYNVALLNAVGGTTPGAGNLLWDNSDVGVGVYNYDTPVDEIETSIRGNSIFGNTNGGIFLYQNANNGQAAPVLGTAITGASGNANGTSITGTLTSAASKTYAVDFFTSPSGAQGQSYIGSMNVTTNGSGTGTFTAALPVGIPSGVVTAIATDPNGNSSAFSAAKTITIGTSAKWAQSITFPPIANQAFNAGNITLNATATSGLAVSYTVTTGSATVSSNTLTITGTGTITVRANQAGNATYNAATAVTQTFTAGTASQTITFPAIAGTTYGVTPITLAATDSSGVAITYTVVSGPATISGNVLTITGAGTVVVQANTAVNANYTAASPVNESFTVRMASQTITFPTIPTQSNGAQVTLGATASSGLAVVYSVISGPATVSGNVLTTTGTGTVTVEANQSGSANYFAANAVDQTFQVTTGTLASTATDTPTMPQWALIILASLLALAAFSRPVRVRD